MSQPVLVTNCWVFRIEDNKSTGPFRSLIRFKLGNNTISRILGLHNSMRDLYQDFHTIQTTACYFDFICGYHTLDHLKNYWPDDILDEVTSKGFTVYKIFVKQCWLTESQCLFLPQNIVKKVKIE